MASRLGNGRQSVRRPLDGLVTPLDMATESGETDDGGGLHRLLLSGRETYGADTHESPSQSMRDLPGDQLRRPRPSMYVSSMPDSCLLTCVSSHLTCDWGGLQVLRGARQVVVNQNSVPIVSSDIVTLLQTQSELNISFKGNSDIPLPLRM